MQKTRDYEHQFVSGGAVGACRLRVYEELGERPVVVATQRREPAGEPDPTSLLIASSVIAANLIEDGTLPEFYGRPEWVEKAVVRGTLQPIRAQPARRSRS